MTELTQRIKYNRWKAYLALAKIPITFFVMLTTVAGGVLFAGVFSNDLLLGSIAIFLLASGSSVINQIQESESDAKMERTSQRPIPLGLLYNSNAMVFAGILILTGMIILISRALYIASLLGVVAILWYNLFYTPLKKYSPWAVIPGAIIGAIPPMIGWSIAGGSIFDSEILLFALVLLIWQIPHFWLLALLFDREYKLAGFPSLTDKLYIWQINRITFSLINAVILFSGFYLLFIYSLNVYSGILYLFFSFSLLAKGRILVVRNSIVNYRKIFGYLNFYMLFIVFFAIALNFSE